MSDSFILDDAMEIKQQQYRIKSAVSQEGHRRRSQNPMLAKTASADGAASKRIELRALSKYEKQRMEEIPARQRRNLVEKQVVWGKVFEGQAFLPSPKVIVFKDFVPGETYVMKVTLTNVSNTFNAFKVLEMPQQVKDIFDISYVPKSMMSAGMNTTIQVQFSPQLAEDVDTVVPLLCKTGPFEIPIQCRKRRVVISVSSTSVDFGPVVVAETASYTVTLTNDGAIPTSFKVTGEVREAMAIRHDNIDGAPSQVLRMVPDRTGHIPIDAYSSAQITFTYEPYQVSELSTSAYLAFEGDTPDVVLFLKGHAIDVPVFVDNSPRLNFNCCYYDCLYRQKVSVRNTTKVAQRVQPEIPPHLKGALEYVPHFGFAQPDTVLDFQVKFTPRRKLGQETDEQVRISVQGQRMPIYFWLVSTLTESAVEFSPSMLDFGECATGEAMCQPIRITNSGKLPRQLGFIKVPPQVVIKPESFHLLLPGESVSIDVGVRAAGSGPFSYKLQCRTDRDESYCIPLEGTGRSQPLLFTQPVMSLPSCSIGDITYGSTVLRNVSRVEQQYVFQVNNRYGVEVSPSQGVVPPGGSLPVMVRFTPRHEHIVGPQLPPLIDENPPAPTPMEEKAPAGKGAAAKKKPTKEDEAAKERELEERRVRAEARRKEREAIQAEIDALQPWETSVEGEQWGRFRTIQVPCHVKGFACKATFLEVRTTVIMPELICETLASVEHQERTVPDAPQAALPPAGGKPGTAEGGKKGGKEKGDKGAAQQAPPPPAAVDRPPSEQRQKPEFATKEEMILSSPGITSPVLDFGDVPALHTVQRTLLIKNVGPNNTQLSVEPLDPYGPLSIIKPPTFLRPDQVCEIVAQFCPKQKATYAQRLVIKSTNTNDIVVDVVGEGLMAALAIDAGDGKMTDAVDLEVDMGACGANDTQVRQMGFQNCSPFPLEVDIALLKMQTAPFNNDGSMPFFFAPNKFTVPPGVTTPVLLHFAPDHQHDPFETVAHIHYGGESTKKVMKLSGHGWDKGLYLQLPKPHQLEGGGGGPASGFHGLMPVADDPFACFGDLAPTTTFSIPFGSRNNQPATQTLLIGNNKNSVNGEFAFEGLTDLDGKYGWKVDPVRGTLTPGAQQKVVISLIPTTLLFDTLPIPDVGVVTQCNVRLLLKGGNPPSESATNLQLKGTAWRTLSDDSMGGAAS